MSVRILDGVSYGALPQQKTDVYLPETESFPVFVYLHGGGFEHGSRKSGETAARYLAEHGVAVVSPDYRMYPEAVYPEFLRDCAAAAAWAYNHMGEYGGNGKLFIGGSSAGGYASMMLCFDRRWLAPYRLPEDAVTGYFHDAGQPTTHFNILRERGMDSRRVIVDEAAPLFHVSADGKYPPMHFVVSDNDIPCRYEQTMLMIETMRYLGCDMSRVTQELKRGGHCHYVRKLDPDGGSCLGKMILSFMESVLL